jgi:hypothetical protein
MKSIKKGEEYVHEYKSNYGKKHIHGCLKEWVMRRIFLRGILN